MRKLLLSVLASLAFAAAAHAEGTVTVYTYESFTAEWGPGPQVEKAFEAECGCDLRFVSVADGVALLNRVKLEGAGTKADIVLGLDTNLTAEAKATGLFAPAGIDQSALAVPGDWRDDTFVPFDYGYFAVVYDREKVANPPKSYHVIAENTQRYQAASFAEGHYLQIEVAGMTANGAKNPLAQKFLAFMVTPAFQDVIPETNWMFPAANTGKPLNPAFEKLVKPATTLLFSPEDVAKNRKAWVEEWLQAMSE
jgi:ABC-type thiamine transport system substrate-binding protein